MKIRSTILIISLITTTLFANKVFADGYVFNVASGTIESSNGQVIGFVSNGTAINAVSGLPISQDPGITQVTGTDGQTYQVSPSGQLQTANNNNNDDENNDFPLPNINIGGGTGGGGGGGGGTGGGGGGGGGSSANSVGQQFDTVMKEAQEAPAGVAGEFLAVAAANNKTGGSGGTSPKRSARGGDRNAGVNDLAMTLSGWSQLYAGVRSSPLIIDYDDPKPNYPELLSATEQKRPQLGKAFGQQGELELSTDDIGVDDEVLKTSMAVYQPIPRLQKDFLESESRRDDYLDSALSKRGIAIMTMGFLDKTVGAGLTAIQAQADQDTNQQFLKQIGWTTTRLADPDQAHVFRDTDEKLEACLENAIFDKAAKKTVKGKAQKWVDFECAPSCGKEPVPDKDYVATGGNGEGGNRSGNGSYAYCVCCAETKTQLNKLSEDGTLVDGKGAAKEREMSIVERTLMGTLRPKGNSPNDEVKKIRKFAELFKEMYGDIILQKNEKKSQGEDEKASLRYVYLFPRYSVNRRVMAIRDGCDQCQGETCPVDKNAKECPIPQDLKMENGVCPSLVKILKGWDDIMQQRSISGFEKDWAEASAGYFISGRDIKGILTLNGGEEKSLDGDPVQRMKRVINDFCDSSALSAFTRFHTRVGTIINDHLALNQYASSSDKAKIYQLYNRVTQQLELARMDMNASSEVQNIIQGIGMNYDRQEAGEGISMVAAMQSGQSNAAVSNSYMAFGTATNNVSGGGGGGGTARTANPIQAIDAQARGIPDVVTSSLAQYN